MFNVYNNTPNYQTRYLGDFKNDEMEGIIVGILIQYSKRILRFYWDILLLRSIIFGGPLVTHDD